MKILKKIKRTDARFQVSKRLAFLECNICFYEYVLNFAYCFNLKISSSTDGIL